MVESGLHHQVPIASNRAVVGMLSQGDVMRYLQLGRELRTRGPAAASARQVTAPPASHT